MEDEHLSEHTFVLELILKDADRSFSTWIPGEESGCMCAGHGGIFNFHYYRTWMS